MQSEAAKTEIETIEIESDDYLKPTDMCLQETREYVEEGAIELQASQATK